MFTSPGEGLETFHSSASNINKIILKRHIIFTICLPLWQALNHCCTLKNQHIHLRGRKSNCKMLKRDPECRLRRRWEDAPKNRRGMCCQGNISRMKTFQAPLPHDRSKKMIIKIIFCTTDLYQVGNRGLQGHLWPEESRGESFRSA